MPNARLSKTVVAARISGTTVNSRTSAFQSGILTPETTTESTTIPTGTPMGLLLALTYAVDVVIPGDTVPAVFRGEFRPNARIE